MTENEPVCLCDNCGEELPFGSFAYRLEGRWFCDECLIVYAQRYFLTSLERVE